MMRIDDPGDDEKIIYNSIYLKYIYQSVSSSKDEKIEVDRKI